MINIQSPQYSSSSKADLFSKQRSPSFRNKRIPSVQENYICSSNQNLKLSKSDSPSKLSQQIRRRKSQYMQSNNNMSNSNSNNKKKSKATNNARDIINSIQDLKQQYKVLKQAYKELITEKVNNTEEINNVKMENCRLRKSIEQYQANQIKLVQEVASLKQQISQMAKELQIQRKNNKNLETDLYFLHQNAQSSPQQSSKIQNPSLCKIGQVPQEDSNSIQLINYSDSGILSFSLTSVLQDSRQQKSKRREHIKVLSDLSHMNAEFQNIQIKQKKEALGNFKKPKKEIIKNQACQSKQVKTISLINPLYNLISLKSPLSSDKKCFKNNNSSNSKKKKEDKENIEIKTTTKKKSKSNKFQ